LYGFVETSAKSTLVAMVTKMVTFNRYLLAEIAVCRKTAKNYDKIFPVYNNV